MDVFLPHERTTTEHRVQTVVYRCNYYLYHCNCNYVIVTEGPTIYNSFLQLEFFSKYYLVLLEFSGQVFGL